MRGARIAKEVVQCFAALGVGFFGYRAAFGPQKPLLISDAERDAFNKSKKQELDAKGLK